MHARPILRFRPTAALCCLLGIALAGCTGRLDPTTRLSLAPAGTSQTTSDAPGLAQAVPGALAQPGFYPLRVGNTWEYRNTATFRLIPSSGDAPPGETVESIVRRRIIHPIELDGRDYLPEAVEYLSGGAWAYTVLYRQDASGLYEFSAIRLAGAAASSKDAHAPGASAHATAIARLVASRPPAERAAYEAAAHRMTPRIASLGAPARDIPSSVATRRLPSTERPYELTRLRYPLERKAQWSLQAKSGNPFTAEVIATETLDLPAGRFLGHRIRYGSVYFGPHDSSEYWYGPSGYLMSVAHVEAEATDPAGNIVGRWVYDHREELLDLRLVNASFVELPPWAPRPAK